MSDYRLVAEALARGAAPEMLCMTCPWDRHCFGPPQMTRDEVDERIAMGERADEETARRRGRHDIPVGALVTIIAMAGRDTMGPMCPVFTLRLRGPRGREMADNAKDMMQRWDELGGEE